MPTAPTMNKPPYTINKSEDGQTVEVNLYGEVVESVPIDWWTGEKVEGLFIEGKQFLASISTVWAVTWRWVYPSITGSGA